MFKQKYWWFLLLFCIPFALGAGGGGGGGGGVGSSGNQLISSYADLQCDDHGTLSFTRSAELNPVIVTSPTGEEITVSGSWGYNKFISKESALAQAGEYTLHDFEFGNRKVTCPGVRLSCAWADIKVQECTLSAAGVNVIITAVNISPQDLQYQFSLPETRRTLSYRKGAISTQLQNLVVTAQDSHAYLISIANLSNVSAFEVSIPDCVGRSSVYSHKTCSAKGTEATPAESAGQLQCGGYLDIADRVRCRLHLRKEERKIYSNFYPEECKIRSDSDICLKTYQAVQECWDFPNGEARLNCVKRVLKLGDILTEKANCNALDSGKRENCNQELKQKGYDFIKFRFYNLEQEAEKLMNEGKLNETDVTNFVVKMEQSKAVFNLAKTKEERKQIILQARQSWVELVRKVKG